MSLPYVGMWVLDEEGIPHPEPDYQRAWRWREQHPELWKIAATELPDWWVSTVFLPIDHQYGLGPPLLFETMCFYPGTFRNAYCERYTTRDQALEGHARIVQALRDGTLRLDREDDDDVPPQGKEEVPLAFRRAFEEQDQKEGS